MQESELADTYNLTSILSRRRFLAASLLTAGALFMQRFLTGCTPGEGIYINYYFYCHDKPSDVEPSESVIAQSNVVVLEGFGWTDKLLNQLRRVSLGQSAPDSIGYPILCKIAEFIAGTGKLVYFADIKGGDPMIGEWDTLTKQAHVDFGASLDKTISRTREWYRKEDDFNRRREEKIEAEIGRICAEAKNLLSDQPYIHVAHIIGAAHTGLSHRCANNTTYAGVIRKFETMPFYYVAIDELRRRFRLDDGTGRIAPDDEDIIRTVFEVALNYYYNKAITRSYASAPQAHAFLRWVEHKFLLDEIKTLYEVARAEHEQNQIISPVRPGDAFKRELDVMLREKNITIPESIGEQDNPTFAQQLPTYFLV